MDLTSEQVSNSLVNLDKHKEDLEQLLVVLVRHKDSALQLDLVLKNLKLQCLDQICQQLNQVNNQEVSLEQVKG